MDPAAMIIRSILRNINRIPLPALLIILIGLVFLISTYPYPYTSIDFGAAYVVPDSSQSSTLESLSNNVSFKKPEWTYVCGENSGNKFCKREEVQEGRTEEPETLESCWITCGTHGSVWPFPKVQKRSKETVRFKPEYIQLVGIDAVDDTVEGLMREAYNIILNEIKSYKDLTKHSGYENALSALWFFGRKPGNVDVIKIFLRSNSSESMLSLTTDESYQVEINEDGDSVLSVNIFGSTFFGVRHGLETFRQLIGLDYSREYLRILKNYFVSDKPAFPYRGVLIDPARNFIPVKVLQRIVDGMSYNKLNMLHLHLTDSNTFTFYSKRVPQMTQYGSLSEDEIFYPSDLKMLVKYARVRGVKIIPELDAPSHAGNGWQFGPKMGLGDLALLPNSYDPSWPEFCGQPPCGILNPLNAKLYDVLEMIYADMFDIFDSDLFHMGGDEVTFTTWERDNNVRQLLNRTRAGISLWKRFQTEAFLRLRKKSERVSAILWTSSLTAREEGLSFLHPDDYVIQVWEGSSSSQVSTLVRKGFSLILSYVDKFYLDWGGGTWLGKEQDWRFHNWQTVYDARIDIRNAKPRQILGGEVALWGEKQGKWEVEVKLWPRAAAFAERVWSNPRLRPRETFSRLNYHAYRMNRRGIPTAQLQPESCLHFNGHCFNPRDSP